MSKGRLFIISAPSGAGKTTILRPVLAELAAISFSVSHTTRAPRPGEQNGIDYHFVSKEEFVQLEQKGDFLEWAEVHGNYYGTSKTAVREQLSQGIDTILDIDVQGASQLRALANLPATYIFIAPPSLAVLKQRLSDRKTESAETLAIRLENAVNELKSANLYDYIIVNDLLEEAIQIMKAIIIEKRAASRRRIDGSALTLNF
nr:guanylate kinase [Desulfobulbaceae bacterium]